MDAAEQRHLKTTLLAALESVLEQRLESAKAASLDAAAYATDEEAKADSKWDTQGLEASYLAAGQAGMAKEIFLAREAIRSYHTVLLSVQSAVGVGAYVVCESEGFRDRYLLVPAAGGIDLELPFGLVTTVSLQTPLGQALRGKKTGDTYNLPNGMKGAILEVR